MRDEFKIISRTLGVEHTDMRGIKWKGDPTKIPPPTNAFPKGHIPANKGKKCPTISKAKAEWWKEWRKAHPNHKAKWKCNQKKPKDQWIRADNTSEINAKIVECPHCGKSGNYPNMKRWHFDNCKNA